MSSGEFAGNFLPFIIKFRPGTMPLVKDIQIETLAMPAFDEIAAFVCEHSGVRRAEITEATSLQRDIGIYGDDMDYLMFEYSKRFGVDVSGYLWYFHTGEEGIGIGRLLVRPPNRRVKEIPITVGMLHDFANQGRWAVEYPKHELPRWRLDVAIDVLVGIFLVGWPVSSCIWQMVFATHN